MDIVLQNLVALQKVYLKKLLATLSSPFLLYFLLHFTKDDDSWLLKTALFCFDCTQCLKFTFMVVNITFQNLFCCISCSFKK